MFYLSLPRKVIVWSISRKLLKEIKMVALVNMPFKIEKLQQLGESKDTALKRFLSLEPKLYK